YSTNSKAFKVFNSKTRIVKENLHVQFSKNSSNIAGSGPNWLFDIDALTKSMNYKPVIQTIKGGGKEGCYPRNKDSEVSSTEEPRINQEKEANINNTNNINPVSPTVNVAGIEDNVVDENIVYGCADDLKMPNLEEIVYSVDDEDNDAEADMNNLNSIILVSPIPTTRLHKDHPLEQIIRDIHSAPQTIRMTKSVTEHAQEGNLSLKRSKLDRSYARRASTVQVTTVARIEAIRLFLACASYKDFVVYQMDVKSAFLYGKIKEEVYVCQPPKFEDPDFLDRVYKGEKALYGLHQAPRAWFKGDILLVQIKTSIWMKDESVEDADVHLYRSMIGSLMYLTSSRPDIMFTVCACARFQVTPKVSHLHVVERIFRYLKGQPKLGLWYPKDSPFDLEAYTDSDYAGASLDRKSTTGGCQFLESRLISWQCKKQTVVANSTTEAEYALTVNPTIYTSCIKQLWATAKAKTVNGEVPMVTSLNRWTEVYRPETKLERMGYENLTQKLTFYKAFFSPQWKFLIHTILQCLSAKTTAWNEFSSTMASAIICLATNQKFNFSKYIFDNMVKNLEGGVKFLMYPRFVQVFLDKQVEGMTKHKEIYVTPSHTKKVFANMKREGKGFSGRVTPLFQTMMVQAPEELEPITNKAANEEHVPIHSNDPLLSGEDRLKLNELMELCTNLSQKVLDLENTKTSQAVEIAKLKERVKKLERRNKSRTPGLKRLRKVGRTARIESSEDEDLGAQEDASKQGRKIADLDADVDVTLVDEAHERNDDNLIVIPTTVDELTLAQTLIEIKAAKPKVVTTAATTTTTAVTRPKARGVVVQEPSEFTTTTSQPSQLPQAKDKGKGKMVEPEKPLKKKDQILVDEEIAQRLQEELQAELEEEERLARQKEEEDNLISWDNTQAMMEADYELAQRLQAEEQGELTIKERSKLFVELMDKRKKHFAKLRAEEIRRKPPTKAQKRNQMCTYLKNMANYKHSQLKNKSFEEIQMLFDNTMKWVDSFVLMDSEVVKGSKSHAERKIVPKDDEAVNVESLATKYPIVDWKTHILVEDKMHYQIIRADGSTKGPFGI
ncbi:ribonuclease H-like domain-containing protein, partial [Tanacetum coccineum]